MKTLLCMALCAVVSLGVFAQGAGIYVQGFAGDRGFIAPGSLAKIEGASFVEEGAPNVLSGELPTELAGVRVFLDGQPCGLRTVVRGRIIFEVPTISRFGWHRLLVTSPLGKHWAFVRIAPVAPGIFTNPDGTPLGEAVSGQRVMPFVSGPILNRETRVNFWGSGFRYGAVTAFVGDEGMPVAAQVTPHFLFAGVDYVTFDLPPQVEGCVRVIFAAESADVYGYQWFSNEVFIQVVR